MEKTVFSGICTHGTKNDAVIKLMKEEFKSIEVVRGGSVGIEVDQYDGKIKFKKNRAHS